MTEIKDTVNHDADKDSNGDNHFGFQSVKTEDKAKMVRDVFDNVASKYDIMNDAMSLGVHRLWKDSLIDTLKPFPGMSHIDVAGGTGDIAFRVLDAVRKKTDDPEKLAKTNIAITDINEQMLNVGRNRAIDRGDMNQFKFFVGDAETLPVEANTYDSYTIAFGIRNVSRIDVALRDAYRILKPGGRFLCLEFSEVILPYLAELYDKYSFQLIPKLGEIITQDRDSYQYLVESIRRFPKQEAFTTMIKDAGFEKVSYRNMSGGIVALHSGWKI